MATKTFAIPAPRRAAWMTARARNAAKRGGLVAAIGLLAVILTLLVLVGVPREVNRSVQARVDALPALADTTLLIANLTGALDRLRNAESNVQSMRVAYADRVVSAAANAPGDSPLVTGAGQIAEQTDARKDLIVRVSRARSAPLIENFRAVGEADFLRNDAPVRTLLDSLNEANRDREAYAALGGPDARYAAMTARLTALGQRLLSAAEQRLASTAAKPVAAPAPVAGPAAARPTAASGAGTSAGAVATASTPAGSATNVAAAAGATGAVPPAVADSASKARADSVATIPDSASTQMLEPLSGDTAIDRAAREALDSAKVKLQVAEQSLRAARETNASIVRERERAVADAPAIVPPVAMLGAALVLGLAVGYGVAFYRELKHPRIADAAELERVTDTRVIVHSGASRSALTMRHRRQSDDSVPRVVDTASEAYQLLHVTLTGFGDTSREVEVVSNDVALGATVGVNLAVAAARDSRTTLLVDASSPQPAVMRMLSGKPRGRKEARTPDLLREQMARTQVGRDLYVDSIAVSPSAASSDELRRMAREHDFTVIVNASPNVATSDVQTPASDVILCVRLGVTSLEWVQAQTDELRERKKRLRAVLLWATRAPSVT